MPRTEILILSLRSGPRLVAPRLAAATRVLTRRRERQMLGRLDAHLLRDIGLDPDLARLEAAKPFWRA